VRATVAAYILIPIVVAAASILWAVFGQALAAGGVVVLFIAWNIWSGTRAHRVRGRN